MMEKYSIPVSFFVPAVVALLYPDEQRRVVKEGHEVGIHGWIHELNSELGLADERELMKRSFDVLAKTTGKPPVGMRTPSWDFSQHTLKIVRELGLLYDSSLMADDEPYELLEDGEPTGVVELPVEWIKDDAPYMNMVRHGAIRPHTPPAGVLSIFKSEFDMAVEEEGLCLITMHPHIMGHRSRMAALEELIKYMKGVPGIWFATHAQVAQYCKDNAA
jgi:peptidoglycan/xylan/chitin deacetylase (PgdA/CDA1 family)